MPEARNDARVMLKRQAREFVKRNLRGEDTGGVSDSQYLMRVFHEMGSTGYPGILIPPEYGGQGGGFSEACIIAEEVAMGEPSLSLMLVNHLACCAGLSLWAAETQKRLFMPALSSLQNIGAVALTEPEAGTDIHSIRARLEMVEDGAVLNANKCFVTNTWPGIDCSVLGFFKDSSGLAVVLIPSSAPGFHLAHRYSFAGWDNLPNHALVLQDCTVSLENLVARELTYQDFTRWHDVALLLVSALAIGMGRTCMEEATRYCGERKQGDKRLIENQSLLFRLADMATSIETMRTSLHMAASNLDAGTYPHAEVCMLKLFATGKFEEIASSAMEMAGGYGYSDGCRLSSLYRDAKGLQVVWGSREMMRLEIASALGLSAGTQTD